MKITDKMIAEWQARKDTACNYITAADRFCSRDVPESSTWMCWSNKLGGWTYGRGKFATIRKAIRAEMKGKK